MQSGRLYDTISGYILPYNKQPSIEVNDCGYITTDIMGLTNTLSINATGNSLVLHRSWYQSIKIISLELALSPTAVSTISEEIRSENNESYR